MRRLGLWLLLLPPPACPSPQSPPPTNAPQQHYCIAVATKDDGSGLLRRFGLPQFAAPPPGLPQSAGLGGGRPPVPRFAG